MGFCAARAFTYEHPREGPAKRGNFSDLRLPVASRLAKHLAMSREISIKVGDIELDAELNGSQTAGLIYDALPIESGFNTWGDEIYFEISVSTGPEDPVETVELGDLAYWPPGKAFCIFYGKTPASQGDEIRPASAVNPIGKVYGDVTQLKGAADRIEISRIEN